MSQFFESGVDEPRTYYTDSNKSERERQTTYINAYIYMKSRKMVPMILHAGQQRRHRCKERLFDSVGEGDSGMI